jgi:uncharacterized protein YdeI (YjbR/CyaY-like superfamily)
VAAVTPQFFVDPEALRAWFLAHADEGGELTLGYWKTGTGRPSVTWPQSVDEALCVGWIDGVRRRLDDESYVIRFTPRRPGSTWSAVNVARVAELTAQGRMQPAGLAAFEQRRADRSGTYAYEQREVAALTADREAVFRATPGAREFFSSQPPSYRHTATWWVVSAKRAETRERRLAQLVDDSAHGRRLAHLSRP